mgnify:CR=1 FL=1
MSGPFHHLDDGEHMRAATAKDSVFSITDTQRRFTPYTRKIVVTIRVISACCILESR